MSASAATATVAPGSPASVPAMLGDTPFPSTATALASSNAPLCNRPSRNMSARRTDAGRNVPTALAAEASGGKPAEPATEKLVPQERIAAAQFEARGRESRLGRPREVCGDHFGHRLRPERPRVHNPGIGRELLKRGFRRPLGRSRGHNRHRAHALKPARQERQPPQGCSVRPVGVVHC